MEPRLSCSKDKQINNNRNKNGLTRMALGTATQGHKNNLCMVLLQCSFNYFL